MGECHRLRPQGGVAAIARYRIIRYTHPPVLRWCGRPMVSKIADLLHHFPPRIPLAQYEIGKGGDEFGKLAATHLPRDIIERIFLPWLADFGERVARAAKEDERF